MTLANLPLSPKSHDLQHRTFQPARQLKDWCQPSLEERTLGGRLRQRMDSGILSLPSLKPTVAISPLKNPGAFRSQDFPQILKDSFAQATHEAQNPLRDLTPGKAST